MHLKSAEAPTSTHVDPDPSLVCSQDHRSPPPQVACYEIEVETGRQPDAGTTSRVYIELCGEMGSSGEHRLMYREDAGRTAFDSGAMDRFKLHCRPLGDLLKVWEVYALTLMCEC